METLEDPMTAKERLHQLVDTLPEREAEVAERLLQALHVPPPGVDPLRWKLENAPLDDEPESEEEKRAVEEARADWRAGHSVSHEEVVRQLGLA